MDLHFLIKIRHHTHLSESLSPTRSPIPSIFGSHLHSSSTSFPILAIAIIGILATAILLVSYYVFVIKCCLNWHRIDVLSRFSFSRNRGDQVGLYSPRVQRRGLDESVIQSIPILEYKKEKEGNSNECAVCLNEFIQEEKLRVIPNCNHVFHVDCIDVWLQSNVNCPLCRTSISTPPPFPTCLPQNPNQNRDNFGGRDEDYVVIELGDVGSGERSNPDELPATTRSISSSPRKVRVPKRKKKLSHVSSMGDECIDTRNRDDQFAIQPRRRSISMDSANDKQLYLAVQGILQQHNRNVDVSEVCSSRRSLLLFGQGKGSRSAVLPIESEP